MTSVRFGEKLIQIKHSNFFFYRVDRLSIKSHKRFKEIFVIERCFQCQLFY